MYPNEKGQRPFFAQEPSPGFFFPPPLRPPLPPLFLPSLHFSLFEGRSEARSLRLSIVRLKRSPTPLHQPQIIRPLAHSNHSVT